MLPDLETIIRAVGLLGVWGIVYAESGLLVGLFLPGDSLLFTAGFLASQGVVNIALVSGACAIAANPGDSTGYWFGARVGRKLFEREDSLLFHREHLRRAEEFYAKHGRKTIILARFVPVVRTFAPIVAGMGSMDYRTFLTYNVVGGLLWGAGIPLAGYQLGRWIPDIDQALLPIIGLIIIASIAPGLLHFGKDYLRQRG